MTDLPTRPWDGGDWVPASLLVKAGVRSIGALPVLPGGIRKLPASVTAMREAFAEAGIMAAKNEGRLWRRRAGYRRELEYHVSLLGEPVHKHVLDYYARRAGATPCPDGEWLTASQLAALAPPRLPRDPSAISRWLARRGFTRPEQEGHAWRKRPSCGPSRRAIEYRISLMHPEVYSALARARRPWHHRRKAMP